MRHPAVAAATALQIKQLRELLEIPVTREKKIDRLHELLRQIDEQTPGGLVAP
jgi:hypothetical protein